MAKGVPGNGTIISNPGTGGSGKQPTGGKNPTKGK
jgi:hypothetical protein